MTVYGAIASVITRKVSAFVGEVRAIVNAAKAEEKELLEKTEAYAKKVLATAKEEIAVSERFAKTRSIQLRDDLIAKIEKL